MNKNVKIIQNLLLFQLHFNPVFYSCLTLQQFSEVSNIFFTDFTDVYWRHTRHQIIVTFNALRYGAASVRVSTWGRCSSLSRHSAWNANEKPQSCPCWWLYSGSFTSERYKALTLEAPFKKLQNKTETAPYRKLHQINNDAFFFSLKLSCGESAIRVPVSISRNLLVYTSIQPGE